jgi:ketosteroid isomerase-like protein
MAGSRAVSDREPGQIRKEAALSGPAHAPRTSLAGAEWRRARPKTSFDDGCTVRFLPMSETTPEQVVRRLAETWNAGEAEPWMAVFDPEIVFLSSESWPESGPFEGPEAMRTFAEDFRAVWEDVQLEIVELFPGEDGAIAGACQWVTRGRASGVEGRLDFAIATWTRDGRIYRGQFFDELSDARAAVGAAA